MSDFGGQREMTSRKQRRCEQCRCLIQPGERYRRWAGRWDGEFSSMSMHIDCADAAVELNGALGWDKAMLLHEHIAEGGREVLDNLPEAVRARFISTHPQETGYGE